MGEEGGGEEGEGGRGRGRENGEVTYDKSVVFSPFP